MSIRHGIALTLITGIACTPADERCGAIATQRLRAEYSARREAQFWTDHSQRLPPGGSPDSLRRVMRAEEADRARQQLFREDRSAEDSAITLMAYDPANDSLDPGVSAPPRPSDEAWYAEHCYQGTAR